MSERVDVEALATAMERAAMSQSDWPIEVRALGAERDAANALLLDWIAGEPDAENRARVHLRDAGLMKGKK